MTAIYPEPTAALGSGFDGDAHSRMHGRSLSKRENAKAHGAVGDGSTDDILALESARDALGPDGGIVELPAGAYRISRTLYDDPEGVIPVIFKGEGMGDRPLLKSATTIVGAGITIVELRQQGSGVEDLAIHDNLGSSATIGLRLGNTFDTPSDLVWGLGLIQNVQIEGTGQSGTGVLTDWGLEGQMNNVTMVQWSRGLHNYAFSPSLASNANAWTGCKFRECETGIYNEGPSLYLFGCTIENNNIGANVVSGGIIAFGTHFENNQAPTPTNILISGTGAAITTGCSLSSADVGRDIVSSGTGRSVSQFDNLPSGVTHSGSDVFTIIHPNFMPFEPLGAGPSIVHRALSLTARNYPSNDYSISGMRGVLVPNLVVNDDMAFADDASAAQTIAVGTTNGLKIGTATTQKLGFFNHAPVVRPTAYTPTNVTPDKAYDADTVLIAELADVVGTLIADLQALGLIG